MNSSRTLNFIILILLGCALGFVLWKLTRPAAPEVKADRPIPVKLAKATLQSVPYYLSGLGTVQSPNHVILRSQVDGELLSINFIEGQMVSKGDLLAQIDARPFEAALNQAKAQKGRIEAQLSLAQLQLGRNNKLLKSDAVSQQEVDQQSATVAELKASLASMDADIATAEVNLSYTKIIAPVSGRTGIRNVDVGNIIKASDANGIVTVTQINPIDVVFTLPQSALPLLQQALVDTKLPVEALERDKGQALATGTLLTIDNMVDARTGTIKLKATFHNENNALWPGQHVTARLRRQLQENALVIPTKALQRGRDNVFVYRANADNTVDVVPVTIKFENEAMAVIEDGLAVNDAIVVEGQMRLKKGAKITTSETTANTPDKKQ